MEDRLHRSVHRVIIRAERQALFEFLAELPNHWQLLGASVESFESRLGGAGAVLHMRASPLPFTRRVETEIIALDEPAHIHGRAKSRSTRARIVWTLEEIEAGVTSVTLAVIACPSGLVDRLIVGLGGPWLRSRYRFALRKLAAEFGTDAQPENCDMPSELARQILREEIA